MLKFFSRLWQNKVTPPPVLDLDRATKMWSELNQLSRDLDNHSSHLKEMRWNLEKIQENHVELTNLLSDLDRKNDRTNES